MQHSAHIAPGRDGLFNLIRTLPVTLKYENQLIVAEGDYGDRTRPLLWKWPTRRLGRCRHHPHRGRPAGRALGRAPGRGDRGPIAQRLSDVRRPVPRLTFSIRLGYGATPVLASGTSHKRLNQGAIRHDAGIHEADPRRGVGELYTE